MSRRRNNIQGPTSALTDFLRESGITAASIARRAATRNQPGTIAAGEQEAESSVVNHRQEEHTQGNVAEPGPSNSRKRTRGRDANNDEEYESDRLDEEAEDREEGPSRKKQKMSKAAEAKAKAKAKAEAKKDNDSANESADEDEDAYTALSRSMFTKATTTGARPPNGSFEKCARCSNQFTVTQYTMAAVPGPGWLCHKCAKESGSDPFKKPIVPRKRKAPADKRVMPELEVRRVPTLVSICVKVISDHIDNIDALGDLGAVNMDNIIRSLSRHRTLTPENVNLFYSVRNQELTLYDATKLPPPALKTLAMLNPNLTSLRLDFCGCMDSSVIEEWSNALPSLTHLDLLGPYLVRTPAWITFLKSHPALESFRILQSPRFDIECMQTLAAQCKNLYSLRLKEIGKMSDAFLEEIVKLKRLTHLDISDPAESCSEEALIALTKQLGPRLESLDLSSHVQLTDTFLLDALEPGCPRLAHLELSNLPEISDAGVAHLFQTWRNAGKPSLTSLTLARNPELGELALTAVLACTGLSLTHLDINGWRSTSVEALTAISKRARDIRRLDVGWNREMNNPVLKAILDGCQRVEEIKCWGCNRLTVNYPRKRGVKILGVESQTSA